jgi:uncharacterized protein YjbK
MGWGDVLINLGKGVANTGNAFDQANQDQLDQKNKIAQLAIAQQQQDRLKQDQQLALQEFAQRQADRQAALDMKNKQQAAVEDSTAKLQDYLGNRKSADIMGQIDTSHATVTPPPANTTDNQVGLYDQLKKFGSQQGDQAALGELAQTPEPQIGVSSPVNVPYSPSTDMVNDKTVTQKNASMLGALGGYRLGQNTAVDLALDSSQKLADKEQQDEQFKSAQQQKDQEFKDTLAQRATEHEDATNTALAIADKKAQAKSAGGYTIDDVNADPMAMKIVDLLGTGGMTFDMMTKTYPGFSKNAAKREAILEATVTKYPDWTPTENNLQYKAASNAKAIQTITAGNNALSNVDDYINLSDQWKRSGSPAFNKLLAAGQIQVGNQTVSNLNQYNKAVGDEIAGVLGYGTASDMKTKLGLDMTDYNASPEVTKSNLLIARHMLMNRVKTQQDPMGQYGQRNGIAPTVPDYGSLAKGAVNNFNNAQAQTKTINGVIYTKVNGGWQAQ